MKNIYPVLFVLVLLVLITTLFPPYSWGDEKLRTISERNHFSNYYSYNLPLKEYDFIFNPVKKDFIIGNNKISLERHIIFSELILEYILCFAISIIFYLLFLRFKFKVISVFLYLLLCSFIIVLWSYKINDVLLMFRPSYEKVLKKESEIKNEYADYISNQSVYTFLDNFRNIYNNNYSLDYWTKDAWGKVQDNVSLPQNMLPDLDKFISVKPPRSNKRSTNRYFRQRTTNRDGLEDYLEELVVERVRKLYPNFILPKGKIIDSNELYETIDKIKLKFFINSLKNYFDYFDIRDRYFTTLNTFWSTVNDINFYGRYILIMFFLLLVWFKRYFIINKSSIYIEKLFYEKEVLSQ